MLTSTDTSTISSGQDTSSEEQVIPFVPLSVARSAQSKDLAC